MKQKEKTLNTNGLRTGIPADGAWLAGRAMTNADNLISSENEKAHFAHRTVPPVGLAPVEANVEGGSTASSSLNFLHHRRKAGGIEKMCQIIFRKTAPIPSRIRKSEMRTDNAAAGGARIVLSPQQALASSRERKHLRTSVECEALDSNMFWV